MLYICNVINRKQNEKQIEQYTDEESKIKTNIVEELYNSKNRKEENNENAVDKFSTKVIDTTKITQNAGDPVDTSDVLEQLKQIKGKIQEDLTKQNEPLFNEIISMPLSNQDIFNYYYKHNVITKLCIGTPKNCFNIEISFSSKYSWICGDKSKNEKKNNYIFSKSSSFKNLNQEESIMTSQGIKSSFYSEDKIKIEDNTLQFFKFFLV